MEPTQLFNLPWGSGSHGGSNTGSLQTLVGNSAFFEYGITNAYAERVNQKIQEIKRTARGYHNVQTFTHMIYFHLGNLDLKIPTKYG